MLTAREDEEMTQVAPRNDKLLDDRGLSPERKRVIETLADIFKEMYSPAIKKLERT